ncbi:hypothetical protein [Streptomyces mirabilis]|uniref:hypothetical protein n=1 Tax=Streptomyces mirabilis TaxID=68239 RepID=UPI0036F3F426
MSARFAEIDWRPTAMGDISLRRRRDPASDTDVYEVKLGDEFLMSSLFTRFLRGGLGLQAGEESDSCGAGQETGFRPQGETPSTRLSKLHAVRCENQARTPC